MVLRIPDDVCHARAPPGFWGLWRLLVLLGVVVAHLCIGHALVVVGGCIGGGLRCDGREGIDADLARAGLGMPKLVLTTELLGQGGDARAGLGLLTFHLTQASPLYGDGVHQLHEGASTVPLPHHGGLHALEQPRDVGDAEALSCPGGLPGLGLGVGLGEEIVGLIELC